MRVTKNRIGSGMECEECNPHGRIHVGTSKAAPLDEGSFGRIERAYEDCG